MESSQALVVWDEEYSVGIPEVDEQHRGLFELVNRVYEAAVHHASSAEVREIVDALEHYTVLHFADEERYMLHARYPDFPSHKAKHDDFVARVRVEKQRLQAGFPLELDIVNFLSDWLVSHILRADRDFGEYERQLHADVRRSRAGFFARFFGGAGAHTQQATQQKGFGGWLKRVFSAEPVPQVQHNTRMQGPATMINPATRPALPHTTTAAPHATNISPEDAIDLTRAVELLMRWKAQFRSAIEEGREAELDPAVVGRSELSALGIWIANEARQRFASHPAYADVQMWHAELHRQATELILMLRAGQRDKVMEHGLDGGPYALAGIKLRRDLTRLFTPPKV
ncbi:bacteriohemerythrin [Derxia gummosa]|uniref:Bacteriohemerythrin n=1 Tax=Derxia gummosa DSM 723 TaxID=1121388 RepID=A0A8B6XA38_9BURK|nr:bacteriohemerythrin [Derxia gummosa]